jgi:hypothetical protein
MFRHCAGSYAEKSTVLNFQQSASFVNRSFYETGNDHLHPPPRPQNPHQAKGGWLGGHYL